MAQTPWHTYQVLTKRPERLSRVLAMVHEALSLPEPLPNVSVELDEHARRADHLRAARTTSAPRRPRSASCPGTPARTAPIAGPRRH
jgi:protein gp37